MAKTAEPAESPTAGFSTVDDKGRVSLSKAVRKALGVEPGSSVAYIVLDSTLLLIPQDQHLAALMQAATEAMQQAGITVEDITDELPAARAEVVSEAYGAEFLEELERMYGVRRSRGNDQ